MNILEELRHAIKIKQKAAKALGGSVLVWGPGDEKGKRKRKNLCQRLKRQGFNATTSEKLSKLVPSSLSIVQQEDEHWQRFDIILVLNFSAGPGTELARFSNNYEFRSRAYVLYPEEWDPLNSQPFPSSIMRLFPYKERVTHEEYQTCRVAERCLEFCLARRDIEAGLSEDLL